MLNFCTTDDLQQVTKFSGRFADLLDDAVETVTTNFNKYIRRNLEYVAGHTEVFDMPKLRAGATHKIWLEKRLITVGSTTVLLSPVRDFSSPVDVTLPESNYVIDYERGNILLFGPLPSAIYGLRITYNGGYQPRSAPHSAAMDCPVSLRSAAIEQAVYEADRRTNSFGGSNESTDKGKNPAATIGLSGLLITAERALAPFKRSIG